MRMSSATWPSLSGTLKSTRVRTRLPAGSRWRSVFLRKLTAGPLRHHEQRVDHPLRESPFVVVPRERLDQRPVEHAGRQRIEHAAGGIPDHVRGDDWIDAVLQDPFELAF